MTEEKKQIPEAESDSTGDGPRDLCIGDPFVIVEGVELPPADKSGIPGSFATVRCSCGQLFRMNLLDQGMKACPKCDREYSHWLIVGCPDNPDLGYVVVKAVFETNEPDDLGDEPEEEPEESGSYIDNPEHQTEK